MKIIKYMAGLSLLATMSCTNLDETLYDQVGTQNFYNTRQDVIRAAFRPFEHAYWSIGNRHVINELTADQLITPTRSGWWDDSGVWRILHYHEYNVDNGNNINEEWVGLYQGIGQCNYVIEDLEGLDPDKFGFTPEEFNNIKTQCRVLRAWFYLRALDEFRNVPLAVSFYDVSKNTEGQVEPKVIFDFVESELNECLPLVVRKESLGSNAPLQGQWTQAAVASLLVRLYLNAQVYIGQDRYDQCAGVAQDILDGKYGAYAVADRWDAAFDWDNDNCDEVIFGFPSSKGYSHWLYTADTYWWTTPALVWDYTGDHATPEGRHNTKYAASPSYDLNGNLYSYELGMPVQNFRKYPGDVRMKLYRNLGNGRREGLFFYGYLEYTDPATGQTMRVTAPEEPYELYIRDAVGRFLDLAPDQWPEDKNSSLPNGDHNSGYHFAKYPFYADDDPAQLESDYTEIRLPEIIYSLAECKLRKGDLNGAATLLNSVRKRNYPEENYDQVLYVPQGNVELNEKEMLDEWGREFFAESRRRIDLVRFGKFNGAWWDKQAESDRHTEIFPLMRKALNTNPALVQNPGYNK